MKVIVTSAWGLRKVATVRVGWTTSPVWGIAGAAPLPRRRKRAPSTVISALSGCSLPVQWRVVPPVSASSNDQIEK